MSTFFVSVTKNKMHCPHAMATCPLRFPLALRWAGHKAVLGCAGGEMKVLVKGAVDELRGAYGGKRAALYMISTSRIFTEKYSEVRVKTPAVADALFLLVEAGSILPFRQPFLYLIKCYARTGCAVRPLAYA